MIFQKSNDYGIIAGYIIKKTRASMGAENNRPHYASQRSSSPKSTQLGSQSKILGETRRRNNLCHFKSYISLETNVLKIQKASAHRENESYFVLGDWILVPVFQMKSFAHKLQIEFFCHQRALSLWKTSDWKSFNKCHN